MAGSIVTAVKHAINYNRDIDIWLGHLPGSLSSRTLRGAHLNNHVRSSDLIDFANMYTSICCREIGITQIELNREVI